LVVNQIPYRENKHFTIDRAATPAPKLTWTFTSNVGGFDIVDGFDIEVHYKVKGIVPPVTHNSYPL
jgi:hypothetical protein